MQRVMIMKKNKGFTLVELMAVITIMGVLVVLLIPVIFNIFGIAKKALKDIDKKALIDGVKLYANDMINGNKSITYKTVTKPDGTTEDVMVEKKITYKVADREIDGYEFVEYAAKNGITVNARFLVENGYFDNGCNYDDPKNTCKVDPDCQLHVSWEYTTVKANPNCNLGDDCKFFYSLGDMSASVVDEKKCVIK